MEKYSDSARVITSNRPLVIGTEHHNCAAIYEQMF